MTVTVPKDAPKSLRDEFAMAALPGLMERQMSRHEPEVARRIVAEAYLYADTMLEARRPTAPAKPPAE